MDNGKGNLLKPARAAKILDVARPTIYKIISQGLLPAVRWGPAGERQTVRIHPDDLRNFIETHRSRPHDSSSCDTPVKPQLVRIENA